MDRAYIGRYRITGKLGRGGMGTVVQAVDEVRQRQVAIKLPNELEADSVTRLKQECELVTRLEHHHIVQVYGSGSEPPDLPFYIVMEFVNGMTVEALLRQQPGRCLEPRRALKIALGVAEALAYAHRPPLRVIHRDIKPANVLITTNDEVKVTDFGIAAALAERTGRTAIGTLAYMAPEQAMGKGVDERTDLYSLGAMLYEMLTGERPPQLASAPARTPSSIPAMATLPVAMTQRVDRLVLGLLEGSPDRRSPQRAEDVVNELRGIIEGRPTRELPRPASSGSMPYDPSRSSTGYQQPSGSMPMPAPVYPPAPHPSSRSGSGAYPRPGSAPYPPYPPPQPVVVNVVQQVQQVQRVPMVPMIPVVPIYVRPSSGKASTALALAIISWFTLGPILSLPAVICGHLALGEIRQSNGQLDGHGKAVAGLVIGYLNLGLVLFFCLIALASSGGH